MQLDQILNSGALPGPIGCLGPMGPIGRLAGSSWASRSMDTFCSPCLNAAGFDLPGYPARVLHPHAAAAGELIHPMMITSGNDDEPELINWSRQEWWSEADAQYG